MNPNARQQIKQLISQTLRNKLHNYNPETDHKPFFQAIFNEKQIFTASLIQSFYTTFGMSIYEQIAVILANSAGFYAERQYNLLGEIDQNTEQLIEAHWQNLKTCLKNGQHVNCSKRNELDMVYNSIQPGRPVVDGDSTVDVYIRTPNGIEYFIDITTVKNNLKSFEALKLKMIRWIGLRLSTNHEARFNTLIALPYNPYYPAPYFRWNATILDGTNDILIQEEFWNFVGNDNNTYTELIEIFQEVGQELHNEIDDFFNNL